MELQAHLAEYERNGIAVFAISYDSVDVLRAFGEKYGIGYPLLSDRGSAVITRLGLLNERLAEHHEFYGGAAREDQWGVPYPGSFILDADGVVVEKRFEQSYRERETAIGMLEGAFGAIAERHGPEARVANTDLAVRAYLDSPTYRTMQRLRLTVEVQIAPGLHVYGRPIPDDYVPLSVAIPPIPGVVVGTAETPIPEPFHIQGVDEAFVAYGGSIRLTVPLTFTESVGEAVIDVAVRYQACTDQECFPPGRLRLLLPVAELRHVERPG